MCLAEIEPDEAQSFSNHNFRPVAQDAYGTVVSINESTGEVVVTGRRITNDPYTQGGYWQVTAVTNYGVGFAVSQAPGVDDLVDWYGTIGFGSPGVSLSLGETTNAGEGWVWSVDTPVHSTIGGDFSNGLTDNGVTTSGPGAFVGYQLSIDEMAQAAAAFADFVNGQIEWYNSPEAYIYRSSTGGGGGGIGGSTEWNSDPQQPEETAAG